MCGQRWGLLERIFISESRKLTAATGYRHLDKRTLPLVEGKSKVFFETALKANFFCFLHVKAKKAEICDKSKKAKKQNFLEKP